MKKRKKLLQITSKGARVIREHLSKKPIEEAFAPKILKPEKFTRTRVKTAKNGVHVGPWEAARAEELFLEPAVIAAVSKELEVGWRKNGVHIGPAPDAGSNEAKKLIIPDKGELKRQRRLLVKSGISEENENGAKGRVSRA